MPGNRTKSLAERYDQVRKRVPFPAVPTICFLALLIMGVVMLYPGRYHDGAAGRTVCVIGGAGLGWFGWSWLRHALEIRLSQKRRPRNGG